VQTWVANILGLEAGLSWCAAKIVAGNSINTHHGKAGNEEIVSRTKSAPEGKRLHLLLQAYSFSGFPAYIW